MELDLTTALKTRRRLAVIDKAARGERIFAELREGWTKARGREIFTDQPS